jgi:hypothetical protein
MRQAIRAAGAKRGGKLKGGWNSCPEDSDFAASLAGLPKDLPDDYALRPAEADFVEVQVRMIGADVVKYAGHGTEYT